MKIIFTDKCKDRILHGKNGIKFTLKGYIFYSDEFPDLEDTEELTIKALELKDLDFDKVIFNEYKKDYNEEFLELKTVDLHKDVSFDLTYIPAMESKIVEELRKTWNPFNRLLASSIEKKAKLKAKNNS